MLRKFIPGGIILMAMTVLLAGNLESGEKDKVSIKFVMQKAMKGDLLKKVTNNKADAKERQQLIELFTALTTQTPPKGSAESWKTKTQALVNAAKANDVPALARAANCDACHEVHRVKK